MGPQIFPPSEREGLLQALPPYPLFAVQKDVTRSPRRSQTARGTSSAREPRVEPPPVHAPSPLVRCNRPFIAQACEYHAGHCRTRVEAGKKYEPSPCSSPIPALSLSSFCRRWHFRLCPFIPIPLIQTRLSARLLFFPSTFSQHPKSNKNLPLFLISRDSINLQASLFHSRPTRKARGSSRHHRTVGAQAASH